MITRRTSLVLLALLVATAATGADARDCANAQFRITTDFDGGRFAKCKAKRDGSFEITILPEDRKVVVSYPWYAFRVSAATPAEVRITLRFPGAYARLWPKLSTDGTSWRRAPEDAVQVSESRREMRIKAAVAGDGLVIAAQELLPLAWYDDWFDELAARDDIDVAIIGESVEGRPLRLAKTAAKRDAIILLGRQHPPEIPGAMAMRAFVDVVLGDSDLARGFRERFMLLIVPVLNPDGVANGHWRHNSGRTDLNRDWGIFGQPETRAIAALLDGMDALEVRPRLMLDFHATSFTTSALFYTQTDDEVTNPEGFAVNWLSAVATRIPDYAFDHEPGPSDENPNSKGYFFRRYGIPAITYEIGDAADRPRLLETTPVFAEEMMREMLRAN